MEALSLKDRIDAKNSEIERCLDAEIVDVELLNQLVERRHGFVVDYLASLDATSAKAFAEQETLVQQKMQTRVESLFETTKSDLAKFLKARKLAAKYK